MPWTRTVRRGVFLVPLCLSCSEGSGTRLHPTGDEWNSPVLSVDSAGPPTWLQRLASSLDSARLEVVIGDTSSLPGGALARPTSVVESGLGGVYLLDAGLGELRWYDWDGKFRKTVAGSGAGPTEILHALSIQVLPESGSWASRRYETVEVPQRVGLKRLRVSQSEVQLVTQYLPPAMPLASGACSNRNGTFARRALGIDSGLAFKFDDGKTQRPWFGQGYQSGSTNLREEISAGLIACDTDGLVLLAFKFLPRLELYDGNGALLWRSALSDFTAPRFEERISDAGVLNRLLDDGGSMVHEVRALPNGGFIVQVFHVAAAVRGERFARVSRRSTFLVAAESPTPVVLTRDHGELVGITRSHIWTRRESERGEPIVEGFRYVNAIR